MPHISWSTSGRYLGYHIGPGKDNKSWEKPAAKFRERLQEWPWSELGLEMAMTTYNIYVASVLMFVAQLETPPHWIADLEAEAVRRVAPGPGAWCSAADLHHGDAHGLGVRLRPLEISCVAARLRVHAWEDASHGRVPWRRLAAAFRDTRRRTDYLLRDVRWKGWFDRHMPSVIHDTAEEQACRGIDIAAARAALGNTPFGPLSRAASKRFRRSSQRWFVNRLLSQDGFYIERRLRQRLQRWRLPDLPGRVARRVAVQLQQLRRQVPPRVRAATMSTIMNRWTTDRRMRSIRGRRGACVLGCSPTADDSVEHYFCCPEWRRWLRRRFGSALADHALPHALLAVTMPLATLRRQAVATYVLYRAVNQMRRSREWANNRTESYSTHCMDQLLHEAVRDDPRLRKCCREAGLVRSGGVRRQRSAERPTQQHVDAGQ